MRILKTPFLSVLLFVFLSQSKCCPDETELKTVPINATVDTTKNSSRKLSSISCDFRVSNDTVLQPCNLVGENRINGNVEVKSLEQEVFILIKDNLSGDIINEHLYVKGSENKILLTD